MSGCAGDSGMGGPIRARNLRKLGGPAGKAHEWAATGKGPG
jgi:hypothetical protein